jgi:hypothetical protein
LNSSTCPDRSGKPLLTYHTLHLYLNSSPASSPIGEEIAGGVTVFSFHDGKQRLDIKPTSGSLRFIIQHEGI